jgi:solute carrier family 45 protein 1/2/4
MGYAIGSIDTVRIIGTIFGDTQFKQMTVFAALFLVGSVLVTSYAVKERVLITARWILHLLFARHANSTRDSDDKPGAIQVASELIKTTMDLPPRIQAICWAQFWAWIGMSGLLCLCPLLTV